MEIDSIEIRPARNGYWVSTKAAGAGDYIGAKLETYAFESYEALMIWLKKVLK